ncbi:MAG TPA: cytochrome b [Oleiagrimonas sp.]|nr:cytochrome b [Oleiagrimonas sp.]
MSTKPMSRYRPVQRWLHWVMFALVVTVYVLINLHHSTPRESPWHEVTEHAHMVAGVLVLLLILPRLWARHKYGAPPAEPGLARAVRWFARITHWALYAFLLIQPLLGLITVQVAGGSVELFGVTLIPALVSEPNRDLAGAIFQYHALIGTTFYWIIGLHIVAALWHHFLRRDDTLRRMVGAA